jgi:hypothetical protein
MVRALLDPGVTLEIYSYKISGQLWNVFVPAQDPHEQHRNPAASSPDQMHALSRIHGTQCYGQHLTERAQLHNTGSLIRGRTHTSPLVSDFEIS